MSSKTKNTLFYAVMLLITGVVLFKNLNIADMKAAISTINHIYIVYAFIALVIYAARIRIGEAKHNKFYI